MDPGVARDALGRALDGLLVALVALEGLEHVELPLDGLDAALREDAAYVDARVAFDDAVRELREVLGEVHLHLVLRLEERANAVTVAATTVVFRMGMTLLRSGS